MADENLGLDTKNEPSNEVNKGSAEPEKTNELGGSNVEKKPTAPLWMSQLPKEMREEESLMSFASLGDLAKAYLKEKATPNTEANEKSDIGFLNSVLGDNDKDWAEFRSEFVKDGEENKELDKFIKFAKDSSLTPKQAKALLENSQKEQTQVRQRQMEEAPKKCKEFLQHQWGDNYDKGIQDMKKGIEKLLGDDEYSKNFKKLYQNDPYVSEVFRRVGAMLEDKPKTAFTSTSQHSQKPNINPYNIPNIFGNKKEK